MDQEPRLRRLAWLLSIVLGLTTAIRAQTADDPSKGEDARDQQVMERFLTLLEKSPRRGTALDRVYGYHVERGTLDAFIQTYQDRVAKDPKDGAAWLLLGLLESQRGHDAASVTALRKAEETRPDDSLPSYYLGRALVLVGQPDAAADAFERAITRKPARSDLLEIYQALGRVHQRAQRHDKALEVWGRLEKAFPDDLRVQEQIAAALAEESHPEQALARYEAIADKIKDEYQRVTLRIEAADLKVRLNRTDDALKDFETLLGRLNPDSWLYREVRRKIEEVFLRNDDLTGLTKYYTAWVEKNPEDVEAMSRLGRTLASQGRAAEARPWFDKAVKLAPTRRALRQALIEQLVQEKKYAEAGTHYEAMAKADPGNPDTIREWGRLLLRDPSRPEAERKKAAADVWRKLVEAKPDDPAIAIQVADLFRQTELPDDAIALYKKAIALAPKSTQYYEYLGEYYHTLKRPDDAKATWAEIARGPNKNAKNLARLAEVLGGFGYKTEAVEAAAAAVALEGDNFDLRVQYAKLLHQLERFDDDWTQLDAAAKLADNDDQRESVLIAQITNLSAAGRLEKAVETLRGELDRNQDATAERWQRLARYYEADQQLPEATAAIRKAVALDPKSVPGWTTSARLHEGAGDLGAAVEAYRTLVGLDRRNRAEYLTNVAKLESKRGRRDDALKAGRELLAAAPGNAEHYQFFAELCFGIGEVDQGLDTLRRSVRLNPSDSKVLLALAEALAQQFRTEEAIELFWRAFDKATELDARLGVVARLTDLYLQRNQFDRLVARLEREQREVKQQREMALCLAAAYQASGDYGAARRALEKLAASNARDTVLLGQLSGLAEREGDYTAAAKYQQQVIEVTPSDEGSVRLADLLARTGDVDGAEAVWERLATGEQSSYRTFQALDNLLANQKYEAVLRTTEKLLRQRPGDWEAIYREGAALAGLKKNAEAAQRFRALLAMRTDDDELSTITKAVRKGLNTTARLPGAPAPRQVPKATIPLQDRLNAVWQVRAASELEPRYYYSVRGFSWAPADFGQARMAAAAFLLVGAQRENRNDEAIEAFRSDAAKATAADPRPRWDLYYLNIARNEPRDSYEAARDLARLTPGDPSALWVYFQSLSNRGSSQGTNANNANAGTSKDRVAPLRDAEIDAMVTGFETLRRRKPEWVQAQILTNVAAELKRAKRKDQEERFYREAIAAANTPDALLSVLTFSGTRGNVDDMLALFDRYSRVRKGRAPTPYASAYADTDALAHTMLTRAEAKAHTDVLRVLDHYLAAARREQGGAGRRSARSWSPTNQQTGFQIWLSKSPRSTQLDFPAPNDYFDLGALQLLREAFELYKRDDLLSDLFAHITEQADKGPDENRVPALLALSYLHWWNDEKNEALKRHEQAGAAAKDDPALRLELAELHEKRGEPADALATADAVEPLDQATLQRREHLALRLAVATGNVARARKASERLFGLRLDTDTQVRLAGQMHQLAMHELAETVLARARRRAGNRSDSLMALMQQYQKQNKTDLAVQVAHQLLRKAPAQQSMPGYYYAEDQYRHQAIQTLARSGKLKELISRAEAQLAASPQSIPIHQTLVDYYTADGQKDKVRATYDRMANLRPDDAKLRMQIAEQMLRSGENAAAVGHYRAAFKKEPVLLGYRYWEVYNTFQAADRLDDLAALYEEIDLRATGNVWGVGQLAQNLMQDTKRREQGLRLFRKAWQAFPTQRPYLIANLENPEVWKLPELYDFVRDGVMPRPGQAALKPWVNLEDRIFGNAPDGRLTTVVSRLLEVATRQNKLGALEQEIQSNLKSQPEWLGGQAILALVRARRGHTLEARRSLDSLDRNTAEPMPALARWVIGQELEEIPALEDISVAMYEAALKDDDGEPGDFDNSPVRRLVALYKRAGRVEDGRRILSAYAAKGPGDRYSFDPDYGAYMRVMWTVALGQRFLDLGAPAETIRLYNEMLADTMTLQTATNWGGDNSEIAMREGMKKALQNMNRDTVATTLDGLLSPAADSRAPAALDLVVLVQPRELDRAAVVGLMATALRSAADEPDLFAKTKARLAKLAEERPKDLSVQTASTLAALAEGKPEAIDAATARLVKLVDETPLETLAPGTRANSRQRAEALRQVGLWLVARECWKHDSVRAVGDKLAERALAAARRQPDALWALAMLRERGRLALERGDRAGTEQALSQMIEHVFAGAQGQAPGAETPREEGKAKAKEAVIPVTLDRFQQAAQVALLAARNDLPDVSFRAIRQALRGGPPIVPPPSTNSRFVRSSNQDTGSPEEKTAAQVESRVAELETLWRERGVPEAAIYETLREIALPEARPSEIFVFARPFSYRAGAPNLKEPRSVAVLLARWAVRAGKADDLRRRVTARLDQPLASLAGQVLLAHLAREAHDAEAAAKALSALGERLEKDSHDATSKLAYHVALPSLRSDTSAKPALTLLDSAVKNLAKETANEPLATFQLELAQLRFDQHDAPEGTRLIKDFLALYDRSQQRQNGNIEYSNHQRRQWLSRGAAALARGGQWDEALDALGQVADVKESNQYYWWGDSGMLPRALDAFGRHLAGRPAAERYTLLKAWTLPSGERKQVRLLAAFLAAEEAAPAAFGKAANAGPATDLACTAHWLIDAAREADKLDELAEALAQVEVPKDEGKDKDKTKGEGAAPDTLAMLRLLTALARGHTDEVRPALESRLAALLKVNEGDAEQKTLKAMVGWPDYLLTRAGINDPKLAPLGERLARRLIERDPSASSAEFEDSFPTRLRLDLMRSSLARSGGAFPVLGLSHWQPASYHRAGDARTQFGRSVAAPAVDAPGLWVERDGTVAHLGGPDDQFLILDTPVEGRFEVSVDAFVGRDASGLLAYGGLVLEPSVRPAQQQWRYGNTPEIIPPCAVWPFGRNERINRNGRFLAKDAFNRLSVQVEPGKVRYLVNGHLFYEDEHAGGTSPFLALGGVKTTQAVFRNLAITGEPVIPREVRLSQGDRLDGWVASFYEERLPVARQGVAPPDPETPYQPAKELGAPEEYDWYARDGVIHGRVQPSSGLDPAQSRLYYHRPLRDGETVSYEFYYEPGAILAHPALGRLAFLLDPSGVRLHWMTAKDGSDQGSIRPDNSAEEPKHRRAPLNLKPAAWNPVTLSLKGNVATLQVNGATVYERPMEASNDLLFGFYHDKAQTAAWVRNVVLKGPWSDAARAQPFARRGGAPGDVRVRDALIGEQFVGLGAGEVVLRARALAPAERYAFLRDWVIPGSSHAEFRLFGHFTPTDPPPGKDAPQSRRAETGGTLEAPAIELVATARALDKLDELATAVTQAPTGSERGRLALLALVRAEQGRDDDAREALERLKPMLAEVPADSLDWTRWPEMVAASRAVARPALRPAARGLLDMLAVEKPPEPLPPNAAYELDPETGLARSADVPRTIGAWLKHARYAQAIAASGEGPPDGAQSTNAAWSPVTHGRARTRGEGHPQARWFGKGSAWSHQPGHDRDAVYLNVPLQGGFEVEYEVSAAPGQAAQVVYGGLGFGVRAGGSHSEVWPLGRTPVEYPIDAALKDVKDWYACRLVVRDGSYAVHVNGRKVHEQGLAPDADPWLALHVHAEQAGQIRNVVVKGQPRIPERLELSAAADLGGWLATYYDEPMIGERRSWEKRGDEIFGRLKADPAGSRQESVLQYHRPLLEDGSVEYEFFYEPGKVLAHPALDRLAFLLDADGVRVHWLTDAQYDRSHIDPANAQAEPDHRRGPSRLPLKPHDWNRLSLSVAGDTATLTLNGTVVYERPIDATNQRTFGLFHFADETEVRVRNVVYRGNWSRTLPAEVLHAQPAR